MTEAREESVDVIQDAERFSLRTKSLLYLRTLNGCIQYEEKKITLKENFDLAFDDYPD